MSQPDLFDIDEDVTALLEHVAEPEHLEKWKKTLSEIFDVAAAVFRREGFDEVRAAELAAKTIHAIAWYHGGRFIYLPTNQSASLAVRDRTMFHAWMTGKATPEQLADKHGISYTRVMQIIAEQRVLWRRRHEPELPGMS